MSISAIRFAISFPDLTASERYTLIILADRASKTGHAFPSQKWISEKTGLSIRTIRTALIGLEKKRALKRSPRFNDSGRTSDDYLILCQREQANIAATPRQNVPRIPSSPYGVRGKKEEGANREKKFRVVGGAES